MAGSLSCLIVALGETRFGRVSTEPWALRRLPKSQPQVFRRGSVQAPRQLAWYNELRGANRYVYVTCGGRIRKIGRRLQDVEREEARARKWNALYAGNACCDEIHPVA